MAFPQVAVIDNFDSFTFNLVHYLEIITGKTPHVFRNDVSPELIKNYDALLFSPGPGLPSQAGNMMEMIRKFSSFKKILGVCLGHQAIGEVFGASISNLPEVLHGVACTVHHSGSSKLFNELPSELVTGHYHSWVISRKNFPDDLEIIAEDHQGNIMALTHRRFEVTGIQFHPESILTPSGLQLLENWLLA
ncbi:MAG: aminodeoxychorismate/anthranilate synthase component II [Bacteroidia bacterium]|nr:aminodeoxychorismate/anthranilate synthase component II [Bacteroidia bacterium]